MVRMRRRRRHPSRRSAAAARPRARRATATVRTRSERQRAGRGGLLPRADFARSSLKRVEHASTGLGRARGEFARRGSLESSWTKSGRV